MNDIDGFVSRLDSPVLVVTATSDSDRSGCLATFVTQCSIRPPRLLVCLSVANHTYKVASASGALGVHILGRNQLDLASLFGEETGDEVNKLDRVQWRAGVTGTPILRDCAAWMEGTILNRSPLGDHDGFLLESVDAGLGDEPGSMAKSLATQLRSGHPV